MKILWLASWYPSENSPFNGDFIQRHAQAASLFNKIDVIYVVKHNQNKITINETGNLREEIRYYKGQNGEGIFPKIYSNLLYIKNFKNAIRQYIKTNGVPDLIHVHVCMKAGLAALWAKKHYNINFVITEHWTGFLKEADFGYNENSYFFRKYVRKIFATAISVSAVSDYLAQQIQPFVKNKVIILPNVVNTNIFKRRQGLVFDRHRFIHVSGLDFQKNPEIILDAIALLVKNSIEIQVDFFGPINNKLLEKAKSIGIDNQVRFYGEVPQEVISKSMSAANALLLPSRYETFGCVIIEANAVGIPVIVTDIPVLHEVVSEGKNGNFVTPGSASSLASVIEKLFRYPDLYDRDKIAAETAAKFRYEVVGRQFNDYYKAVLSMF